LNTYTARRCTHCSVPLHRAVRCQPLRGGELPPAGRAHQPARRRLPRGEVVAAAQAAAQAALRPCTTTTTTTTSPSRCAAGSSSSYARPEHCRKWDACPAASAPTAATTARPCWHHYPGTRCWHSSTHACCCWPRVHIPDVLVQGKLRREVAARAQRARQAANTCLCISSRPVGWVTPAIECRSPLHGCCCRCCSRCRRRCWLMQVSPLRWWRACGRPQQMR
jgi:hypothetical protein